MGEKRSGDLSEFDFIRRLRQRELTRLNSRRTAPTPDARHPAPLLGIGDDAAVIRQRAGFDTVITADLLVEGIDFELGAGGASARDVGHKALAVSLSDVAAMGARPTMCLLSVGVPRGRWRAGFLEEFYRGVRGLAGRHGVSVIGGDISRTPERVVVDSVVLGEVRRGRAVLRSGARPGDQIFVTGRLGGAAAGLQVLTGVLRERAGARLTRAEGRLVKRQLRPEPRVEWGRLLGEGRLASAMIDLSDGLSSDLAHLCRESGVGAFIEAESLPLDPALKSVEADALRLALDGGEDFELLFTVPPKRAARVPAEVGGVPATRVGEVTDDRSRLTLVRGGRPRPLRPGGFEHFGGRRG